MKVVSVNHVLQSLEEYDGKFTYVEGLLNWEFENVSILHWPKAEQDQESFYQSSLWLNVSVGLDFDETAMNSLNGKKVVVEGRIMLPSNELGGCGHMSLWLAEVVATQIERYT